MKKTMNSNKSLCLLLMSAFLLSSLDIIIMVEGGGRQVKSKTETRERLDIPPLPPFYTSGKIQDTCIASTEMRHNGQMYFCPGDFVSINIPRKSDWKPLRLSVASPKGRQYCSKFMNITDGGCYRHLLADGDEEVQDSMKFQVFPVAKNSISPESPIWPKLTHVKKEAQWRKNVRKLKSLPTKSWSDILSSRAEEESPLMQQSEYLTEEPVWSVILKDSQGFWVQSSSSKPLVEQNSLVSTRKARDVLLVDAHQPASASNGTAEVFYLIPTKRVIADYWFVRARDGCVFRQIGQSPAQINDGRTLKDGFSCDSNFDPEELGVTLSLEKPPPHVKNSYTIKATNLNIDWSAGRLYETADAPGITSAIVVNYGKAAKASIGGSTTHDDSMWIRKEQSWGFHGDALFSVGFGADERGRGGTGLSLTFKTGISNSESRTVESRNSTAHGFELNAYPLGNTVMRTRSRVQQQSFLDVPFSYQMNRHFFDGTVASWNVTGTLDVSSFQKSNMCFGAPVKLGIKPHETPVLVPDCRVSY